MAATSRLLKITGLFCRISSLLQGSFAKAFCKGALFSGVCVCVCVYMCVCVIVCVRVCVCVGGCVPLSRSLCNAHVFVSPSLDDVCMCVCCVCVCVFVYVCVCVCVWVFVCVCVYSN